MGITRKVLERDFDLNGIREIKILATIDEAWSFDAELSVMRRRSFSPILRSVLSSVGPIGASVDEICENLKSEGTINRSIVSQVAYSLSNAELLDPRIEETGIVYERSSNPARQDEIQEILEIGNVTPLLTRITGFFWPLNCYWNEKVRLDADSADVDAAFPLPSLGHFSTVSDLQSNLERRLVEHPPSLRRLESMCGEFERRSEVLEKAGLMTSTLRVTSARVERLEPSDKRFMTRSVFLVRGRADDPARIVCYPIHNMHRDFLRHFEMNLNELVGRETELLEEMIKKGSRLNGETSKKGST